MFVLYSFTDSLDVLMAAVAAHSELHDGLLVMKQRQVSKWGVNFIHFK